MIVKVLIYSTKIKSCKEGQREEETENRSESSKAKRMRVRDRKKRVEGKSNVLYNSINNI
jgi:hypothetical protein